MSDGMDVLPDGVERSAGPARLRFGSTGSLEACRLDDTDLVASHPEDPVFTLQLPLGGGRFAYLDSHAARSSETRVTGDDDAWAVVTDHRSVGGLDLDVRVTVRGAATEPASVWSLELTRLMGTTVTQVWFPFLAMPHGLGAETRGEARSDVLLWPRGNGVLLRHPAPGDLAMDGPEVWERTPQALDCLHYPGFTFAQFLAYLDDRAGLLVYARDEEGVPKVIQPVTRDRRVRLGFAHLGAWDHPGGLGYDMVVQPFQGDWYEAAGIYRDWTSTRSWAIPVASRDIPPAVLETGAVAMIRIRGEVDDGPAPVNDEFLPYQRITPTLDALAREIGGTVLPFLMAWEHGGPWVYPDSLPPVGGADSLRSFAETWRSRTGAALGTYCNGTRWVSALPATGYDVQAELADRGALDDVCRTADGSPWVEPWDAGWRTSMPACCAADGTRRTAEGFVRAVGDLGFSVIQFFDQNLGGCAFPCFSGTHGHPPFPGPWMTERMGSLMASLAREAAVRGAVLSVEGPTSEPALRYIGLADLRIVPPGHHVGGPRVEDVLWQDTVPLYHFLFHESTLIQGGFGFGPRPFHMVTKNAYNVVVGAIPGGVIERDGTFQQGDSVNWWPWGRAEGDERAARAQLANAVAFRSGPAREYLVHGRMERPLRDIGIPTAAWRFGDEQHEMPSVFHGAWRARSGVVAYVLANWTTQTVQVRIDDLAAQGHRRVHHAQDGRVIPGLRSEDGTVVVPPLGFSLVEEGQAA
ncbi:MAG: hypothetical protein KF809_13270 [Chloroflexi bacterium]|nr:hypothetical protein [Chloroflexota bacterium]